MKKTIYIHVGLHKTASTSIQNMLKSNRDILIEENFYFIKDWWKNNSVPMYSMFCDEPHKYHPHMRKNRSKEEVEIKINEYRKILIDEIKQTECENIIISGEDISLLKQHNLIDMIDFFEKTFDQVRIKIVVCLRNPIDLCSSLIQQIVKDENGVLGSDFSWMKFLYEKRLSKFIELFHADDIIAYKFEDACKFEKGPAGYFLKMIGLNDQFLDKIHYYNSNLSLSDKATYMISYINERNPLFVDGKIADNRIHGDTAPLRKIRGEKFIISEDIYNFIFTDYHDLDFLNKSLNIDYSKEMNKYQAAESEPSFGIAFVEDVKMIIPETTPFIRKSILDYISDQMNAVKDKSSRKYLKKAKRILRKNQDDVKTL